MKDWSEDGHFSIAQSQPTGFLSFDGFLHSLVREFPAIPLRDQGQVGGLVLQGRRGWAVASTVGSMTGGALALEDLGSVDGDARLRFAIRSG